MSKLMKALLGAALSLAAAAPASAATYVETFDEPFAGWETRFFGALSNAQNYYTTEPSPSGPDYRGGNVDGLWISDGDNYQDGGDYSNVLIRFDAGFAASLTDLSIDVVSLIGAFAPVTLTFFDVDGATLGSFLLPEGSISPTGNPFGYLTYSVSSTNGIGGFDLIGFAQGSVSVDNVIATTAAGAVPEPASWAMMIGGMGVAGGALRRRARVAATAHA